MGGDPHHEKSRPPTAILPRVEVEALVRRGQGVVRREHPREFVGDQQRHLLHRRRLRVAPVTAVAEVPAAAVGRSLRNRSGW